MLIFLVGVGSLVVGGSDGGGDGGGDALGGGDADGSAVGAGDGTTSTPKTSNSLTRSRS